ncbi:MAG: hypothetical protein OXD54_11545 [Candidatus Poribacteria bacterium]|nr:hypothetical protein [Candidatus Poribacteria bacterium]
MSKKRRSSLNQIRTKKSQIQHQLNCDNRLKILKNFELKKLKSEKRDLENIWNDR